MQVDIGCVCPGAPHQTDTVTLRETLDFRSAVTLRNAAVLARQQDPDIETEEIMAVLTEGYLVHGIEAWSLVDEAGKPVPVTRSAIRERLLTHVFGAATVGNAADLLYAEAVVIPLLTGEPMSSPVTSTDGSTSATSDGQSTPPKRSRRSSTTTTRTDGIETTSASLDGAFS